MAKAKRQPEKTLRLKKDIIIPAGTVFHRGPENIQYSDNNYEHVVGIGKNNTMTVMAFDEPHDAETQEYFEVVD
jgi:hypothetical protein